MRRVTCDGRRSMRLSTCCDRDKPIAPWELTELPAEGAHDDPRELREALGRAMAQLKLSRVRRKFLRCDFLKVSPIRR